MFNNDLQTQTTVNWKRQSNEHTINRALTAYFNANKHIKNFQTSIRSTGHKSEVSQIIHRQRTIRSFLEKPDETELSTQKSTPPLNYKLRPLSMTSISPSHIFYNQLSGPLSNNAIHSQLITKAHENQSPMLIRRFHTPIEYVAPTPARSDITSISDNQLPLIATSHSALRQKLTHTPTPDRLASNKLLNRLDTPHMKPITYSKASENILKQNTSTSKSLQQHNSLHMHRWTPTLSDSTNANNRTVNSLMNSKAYLTRYFIKSSSHKLQTDKINNHNTNRYNAQDLQISTQTMSRANQDYFTHKIAKQKKLFVDDWEECRYNQSSVSDEDESTITDGIGSISTVSSPVNFQPCIVTSSAAMKSDQNDRSTCSPLSIDNSKTNSSRAPIKRSTSKRLIYNIALPTVTEHDNDEETSDEPH